uniref:Mitochondrial fission regulator n=1 Tax=Salvator merianae TaxID=96440 RepID=A0A8D0B3X6_SALMN
MFVTSNLTVPQWIECEHKSTMWFLCLSHSVTWSWERKKYGSSRSFVRQLAKCLSLTPCPRPHFQVSG